jgi:hypothetical protein
MLSTAASRIPDRAPWRAVVDGRERQFLLCRVSWRSAGDPAAGLDRFYRRREATDGIPRVEPAAADSFAISADSAEAAGLILHVGGDLRETSLLIEGSIAARVSG